MATHCEPEMKILVVEDDPTFLKFWRRFLRELNIKTFELVDDPLRAKQLLEQTPYALLISDVILPAMSGFDLARIARRKQPEIEILLTTAYGAKLSRFNLAGLHFHLLHKPYTNLTELKRLVSHLIHGEDVFSDTSDDSHSDNEDYPAVTEWKL